MPTERVRGIPEELGNNKYSLGTSANAQYRRQMSSEASLKSLQTLGKNILLCGNTWFASRFTSKNYFCLICTLSFYCCGQAA